MKKPWILYMMSHRIICVPVDFQQIFLGIYTHINRRRHHIQNPWFFIGFYRIFIGFYMFFGYFWLFWIYAYMHIFWLFLAILATYIYGPGPIYMCIWWANAHRSRLNLHFNDFAAAAAARLPSKIPPSVGNHI